MSRGLAAIRTRWAAIGAAVAVTLGAGGLAVTNAAGDSDPSAFSSITPCRLADTRPGDANVGDKASPLGPGEVHTLEATGASGNCDLPATATAIVANVTALDPTAPTNLRLYPAGAELPTTSNLNPTPGQPPTPNAVTVGLDDDGEFSIRNAFGNVNVIVDLVGYFETGGFDERYAGREVTEAVSIIDALPIGGDKPFSTGSEGCLYDTASPHALVVPIDVPVGAVVTGIRTIIRSADGPDEPQWSLHLISQTDTGTAQLPIAGGIGSDEAVNPGLRKLDRETPVTSPYTMAPGDMLYLTFNQGGGIENSLCGLMVSYTRPEVD